jgi:cytolysin-activating lysine-acyltransferase
VSRPWPDHVPAWALDRATQIGFATQIFWRSRMAPAQSWLIPTYMVPAIALRQAEFDFGANGMPEAVIGWAFLSEAVSQELARNPWRQLHTSEWNEGTELWILALLGGPGKAAPLLRRVLRGRLGGFRRIRGYQRNPDGSIKRLLDRSIGWGRGAMAHEAA